LFATTPLRVQNFIQATFCFTVAFCFATPFALPFLVEIEITQNFAGESLLREKF